MNAHLLGPKNCEVSIGKDSPPPNFARPKRCFFRISAKLFYKMAMFWNSSIIMETYVEIII